MERRLCSWEQTDRSRCPLGELPLSNLKILLGTARHSKSSGNALVNEPHVADILKTLEPAWRTPRQVRVHAGSEYTRPSEFRLIKSVKGFKRLETLTLSAETAYKNQQPKNPLDHGKTLVKLMLPNIADPKIHGTAVQSCPQHSGADGGRRVSQSSPS